MATQKKVLPRKNKATPRTVEIILDAISCGLTQRDASTLAGISEDTLSLWKRQDSDFSEQMRQKEIEYKSSLITSIKKAGEKSWQANAWLLERKYKEEFALKSTLEVNSSEKIQFLTENIKKILTPIQSRKTASKGV